MLFLGYGMKKIIILVSYVLIINTNANSLTHSYNPSDVLSNQLLLFKVNARHYYKAWAIGYCLGYYIVENNVTVTFDTQLDVDKIAYVKGIEPLKELQSYIDSKKDYFEKDKVNRCLKLVIPTSKINGIVTLEDEIERIVKKYCKECK